MTSKNETSDIDRIVTLFDFELKRFSELYAEVEDLPENSFAEEINKINDALVRIMRPQAKAIKMKYEVHQTKYENSVINENDWLTLAATLTAEIYVLEGEYTVKNAHWMNNLEKKLKEAIHKKQIDADKGKRLEEIMEHKTII